MKDKKVILKHFGLRLLAFPVLFGLIYGIIKLINPEAFQRVGEARVAFFGSAAVIALSLMAETILLFGKKRIPKSLSNIVVVFLIILCVIIFAPYV